MFNHVSRKGWPLINYTDEEIGKWRMCVKITAFNQVTSMRDWNLQMVAANCSLLVTSAFLIVALHGWILTNNLMNLRSLSFSLVSHDGRWKCGKIVPVRLATHPEIVARRRQTQTSITRGQRIARPRRARSARDSHARTCNFSYNHIFRIVIRLIDLRYFRNSFLYVGFHTYTQRDNVIQNLIHFLLQSRTWNM